MTRSVGVSRPQARYHSCRAAAERRRRPTTGAWTSTSSPYAPRGPAEIATRGLSVGVVSASRRRRRRRGLDTMPDRARLVALPPPAGARRRRVRRPAPAGRRERIRWALSAGRPYAEGVDVEI